MTQLHERNADLNAEVQNLREKECSEDSEGEADKKSAPASDLSDKAAKVLSYIKTLLPTKTRLPSDAIIKLEKILGGGLKGKPRKGS